MKEYIGRHEGADWLIDWKKLHKEDFERSIGWEYFQGIVKKVIEESVKWKQCDDGWSCEALERVEMFGKCR